MASNAFSRRQLIRGAAVGTVGAALPASKAHAGQTVGSADLVLHGGRIMTMAAGGAVAAQGVGWASHPDPAHMCANC
jgi:hypothetical protein